MLMGRAVAVVGQRHPLARGALAGAGAALQRVAVHVKPVVWLHAQELVGEPQVLLDDAQDAGLGAHREVRANVGEQRPRRAREVVPIDGHPLHGGFTSPETTLMVGGGTAGVRILSDLVRDLPVDRATEPIHRGFLNSFRLPSGEPKPSLSTGEYPVAV